MTEGRVTSEIDHKSMGKSKYINEPRSGHAAIFCRCSEVEKAIYRATFVFGYVAILQF